jgi:hypothetical protein
LTGDGRDSVWCNAKIFEFGNIKQKFYLDGNYIRANDDTFGYVDVEANVNAERRQIIIWQE